MFYLYKIVNKINGKIYIGITKDSEKRWKKHKDIASSEKSKKYAIHLAIRKYGFNNFEFIEIDTSVTWEEACDKETFLIKTSKEEGLILYNLTDGGEGVQGRQWTDEQRKARSEQTTGKKNGMFGKGYLVAGSKHPNYGKPLPDNVKQALVAKISKVSEKQVQELKKMYSTNQYSQTELSILFNISVAQVHRIIHNKRRSGKSNSDKPITKSNITKEQVIEMRTLYSTGGYSQKELGTKYNLSAAQVSRILNNKRWKE